MLAATRSKWFGFPGPAGAAWIEAGNAGFIEAIKSSDIELVDTKYGDTGKEVQLKLIEGTLETYPDFNDVVGTAVTAETAVRILEGKDYVKHVGPQLYVIDDSNVNSFDRDAALAPDGFKPTFSVD